MSQHKRLVYAEEVKEIFDFEVDRGETDLFDAFDTAIESATTIEAVPVVHGRWEDKPTGRYGQQQSWCSACRKHSGIGGIEKNRHRAYCPNCGAKMDGDGHG